MIFKTVLVLKKDGEKFRIIKIDVPTI